MRLPDEIPPPLPLTLRHMPRLHPGHRGELRLLTPGSWGRRAAMLALIFDILLLATTRLYLLWALGIAACALMYTRLRRRKRR